MSALVVVAYLNQYLASASQTWPILCVFTIAIKSNGIVRGVLAWYQHLQLLNLPISGNKNSQHPLLASRGRDMMPVVGNISSINLLLHYLPQL